VTPPQSSAARTDALDHKEIVAAPRTLVLVGNPNVGKSVLFGALTGRYVTVSNYPGTTVEVTRGSAEIGGKRWHVLDTPGTNNLLPMSEDEQVTRDILLKEPEYVCLQVCDAKNLRRGLLLACQLAEAGVPFALALNMADEAAARGIRIDATRLSNALGVDVIPTVAVQRTGLPQLLERIPEARVSAFRARYDEAIEQGLTELEPLLPDGRLTRRSLGLMLLAGDESLQPWLASRVSVAARERMEGIRRSLAARYPESLRYVVSRQRLAAADRLHDQVVTKGKASAASALGRRIGAWSTDPVKGIPILLLVLAVAYLFVGVFGAKTAVDFLENTVFYDHVVPWTEAFLRWIVPAGSVQEFLVGPPGLSFRDTNGFIIGRYGLVSMGLAYGMAIVLPIVATFFLAFSVLEDSGYLPRLAVMVNRVFKWMGLNGKAVLPMVLGLGCDTMATMTARIMETRKERVIVTLLLALGVPCSAQIAVIFAMLGTLSFAASLWFTAVIVLVLFLVGWLAARVIPGRGSDFVLELPPLRIPQLGNVVVKTLARMEWYLREALPLFVLGTLLLWVLDRTHMLGLVERAAAPVVVGVLQLPEQAASAFILGFLRRDYAAAGLFQIYQPYMTTGTMTRIMEIQVTVALVTVTLFIPCIANFLMILKERGWKTGLAIAGFVLPFSVGVGAAVNLLMRRFF